jgi:hypothetical protein
VTRSELREFDAVTIPEGEALSDAVWMRGRAMCGILVSDEWTAAGIGILGSLDGENYFPLGVVSLASAPHPAPDYEILVDDVPESGGKLIGVNLGDTQAAIWVKLQSQTAGTPVNQDADRELTIVSRPA